MGPYPKPPTQGDSIPARAQPLLMHAYPGKAGPTWAPATAQGRVTVKLRAFLAILYRRNREG